MPYNTAIPGWMSEGSLRAIESLAKRVPAHGTVIEVGAFLGRSTWAWARSVPPTATVITMDYWNGNTIPDENLRTMLGDRTPPVRMDFAQFAANTKDCWNIIAIRGNSANILPRLAPQSADLVFIDGGHRYEEVKVDAALALNLLKPTGTLCGDDYSPRWPGVVQAVDEIAKMAEKRVETSQDPSIPIWVLA
jgi:predicted O-methyltransferase YrrM